MATDLMHMEFIAGAIIAYMRAGHRPPEDVADYINRFSLIDEYRARVTAEDVPWLIEVVKNDSGMVGAFYLSLLRRYDQQEDVKAFLRDRWSNAEAFFQAQLLWRILDDSNLPLEWHSRIFNFVLAEWEVFRDSQVRFLGHQNVLVNGLRRVSDPTFPASKKWAYLCAIAAAAENQDAARQLIQIFHEQPWVVGDEFTRQVVEKLMTRRFQVD